MHAQMGGQVQQPPTQHDNNTRCHDNNTRCQLNNTNMLIPPVLNGHDHDPHTEPVQKPDNTDTQPAPLLHTLTHTALGQETDVMMYVCVCAGLCKRVQTGLVTCRQSEHEHQALVPAERPAEQMQCVCVCVCVCTLRGDSSDTERPPSPLCDSSDKDRRERPHRLQAAHQGEPVDVGPGQRPARLQEREARLHHRHPEAVGVSVQ